MQVNHRLFWPLSCKFTLEFTYFSKRLTTTKARDQYQTAKNKNQN